MGADIAGFDPGTTTGMSMLTNNVISSTQIRPENYPHPHESLYDVLSAIKPKKIVYEQFHFRQGMDGAVFKGIEYIGVMELWAQHNYVEVITITPSDGKGFWDDRKLKALGLYKPAFIHGMDAIRVLLRHHMKVDKVWLDEALLTLKEKL